MAKFKAGDIVKVVGRAGIMNMFPTGTVGKVLEADRIPLVQSLYPIFCNERSVQYVSNCDLELVSNSKARSDKSLWKVVISSTGDEGDSCYEAASRLGFNYRTLHSRKKSPGDFTLRELQGIANTLNISIGTLL